MILQVEKQAHMEMFAYSHSRLKSAFPKGTQPSKSTTNYIAPPSQVYLVSTFKTASSKCASQGTLSLLLPYILPTPEMTQEGCPL